MDKMVGLVFGPPLFILQIIAGFIILLVISNQEEYIPI